MTVPELVAILTGIGGLLTGVISWLRWRRETPKLSADALGLIQQQRDACLEREAHIIERAERLEVELAEARAEIGRLEGRLAHVESILPFAMEADADPGDIRGVLDAASEPWGLSCASEGGQITYANPAFCRCLGLTLEQVLVTPWTSLLHPDDVARMQAAEGRAWSSQSARTGHPGRYKVHNAEGALVGYRQLRFFFSRYGERGSTRWLARDEGMVE